MGALGPGFGPVLQPVQLPEGPTSRRRSPLLPGVHGLTAGVGLWEREAHYPPRVVLARHQHARCGRPRRSGRAARRRHPVIAASITATAAVVAAGAAVLAAIATGVLAYLAFRQIRAGGQQSDALIRQADAMDALAKTAAAQEFRERISGHGLSILGTPEQDMAMAQRGIAESLARAFPPSAAPHDAEGAERKKSGSEVPG
jgi:hypothetical protein